MKNTEVPIFEFWDPHNFLKTEKGRKKGKRKEGKKCRKVKDKKGKKRIQSLNVELLDRKQGGKEERKENREEGRK